MKPSPSPVTPHVKNETASYCSPPAYIRPFLSYSTPYPHLLHPLPPSPPSLSLPPPPLPFPPSSPPPLPPLPLPSPLPSPPQTSISSLSAGILRGSSALLLVKDVEEFHHSSASCISMLIIIRSFTITGNPVKTSKTVQVPLSSSRMSYRRDIMY